MYNEKVEKTSFQEWAPGAWCITRLGCRARAQTSPVNDFFGYGVATF